MSQNRKTSKKNYQQKKISINKFSPQMNHKTTKNKNINKNKYQQQFGNKETQLILLNVQPVQTKYFTHIDKLT
jgi:hypothetical protein